MVEPKAHLGIEPASPYSGPKLDRLLVQQLVCSVPGSLSNSDLAIQRADGAVELYQSFEPVDAAESALARVAVALTNAAMHGLELAASPNQTLEGRQIELRLSQKSASTLVDVLTFLDKHRGLDRQKVSVGSVNVGSGGRAIVGNVQSAPKREENPQ